MNFNQKDESELAKRGITTAELSAQIYRFTTETKPLKLERPCTAGDGITILTPANCHRLMELFDKEKKHYSLTKFVPASGAASRMFKHLYHFAQDNTSDLTEEFILNFYRFPFISALEKVMQIHGESLKESVQKNEWNKIFDFIISEKGLHYDSQLKGLVIFHKYGEAGRTAFEEHLHEGVQYVRQADGKCRFHFTLAPQHIATVESFLNAKTREFKYEDFEITFSVQSSKTDTLALTKENEPMRDADNNLVFRPSGHGALIRNIQALDTDIVFIKNIDNVTTDSQREDTSFFKKVIAGLLIELKREADRLITDLEDKKENALENALEFIQHWFQPGAPIGGPRSQLEEYARLRLDRPMRICGMVRNEGEPGGGPFWVKSQDGILSKQIVEKSQVDANDLNQMQILSQSTHFNPVDIVCALKNKNGNKYNLENYIDHSTGFISEKFQDGKVIKALELPGLWNGAMALWNTVFVEVPVTTFHPVKTVNDLLRPGHQQHSA